VISNNLGLPQWSILDGGDATGDPPIYTGAPGANFTQGWVTVDVSVAPPAHTLPVATDQLAFFIAAPSITVGVSPATVCVALRGTQLFAGYAVGNLNDALPSQVDGVTGGSVANGTITLAGNYTAPPRLPMTGATVTVLSQADPTKSVSSLVTLQ
jgi:hypothetical protein